MNGMLDLIKTTDMKIMHVRYAAIVCPVNINRLILCNINSLCLGTPRRRWVDNIRMDLQEVGCGYVDWIGLAQDRDRWRTLVSAVTNLWVP